MTAQHDADEQSDLDEVETDRPAVWAELRIDPIEIALPKGSGYTLRAYRATAEVTATDASERESDEFPDRHAAAGPDEDAEAEAARAALAAEFGEDERDDDKDEDEDEEDDDERDDDRDDDEASQSTASEDGDRDDDDDDDDEEEDEESAGAAVPDEVPVFLGRSGALYLFRTPEGLVDFVRSGAEHDLAQLDTWPQLVEQITAEDVVPLAEDQYELDLVVENLRGGHDAWDAELLIQAGEVARDIGYALQIPAVVAALAPGSPLDDLDEALRGTSTGGVSGFFAKRKLRKIGTEAPPLGWRTIIGKISSVVDWRD